MRTSRFADDTDGLLWLWGDTGYVTVQEIVVARTVGRQKERSACSLCPEGRPVV